MKQKLTSRIHVLQSLQGHSFGSHFAMPDMQTSNDYAPLS